jgi:threonine/homoserine/homoserine lactone efflux protein
MAVVLISLILKGFAIGFAVAAPVGPIGILCINRAVNDGFKMGFVTGCGAAIADGLYGAVAAFGLTFVSSFLIDYKHWIRIIGGIFLVLMGIRTMLKRPAQVTHILAPRKSFYRAFFTTFFLTLTNPMTILAFLAIFAGVGIGNMQRTYFETSLLVLAVTLGSLAWWVVLTGTMSLMRHKIELKTLKWINRFSGLTIVGFGLLAAFNII